MNLEQTVKDYLPNGGHRVIADRASRSRYWRVVQGFLRKHAFTKLKDLSDSEREWVNKIKRGL